MIVQQVSHKKVWVNECAVPVMAPIVNNYIMWENLTTSTNEADRHDITEILLKVPLNTAPLILLPPQWALTMLNGYILI